MTDADKSPKIPWTQRAAIVLVLFVVLAVALVPAIKGFVSTNSHAAVSSPSEAPTESPIANHYDRVLFAGDSISVGRDARILPESFRAISSHWLKANGTQSITTIAKSGAKLNYIAHSRNMPTDLDLAIIELGTNDAGETHLSTRSAKNIRTISSEFALPRHQ